MEGTPCHPRGLTDGAAALRPFVTSCECLHFQVAVHNGAWAAPYHYGRYGLGGKLAQLGPGLLSGSRVQSRTFFAGFSGSEENRERHHGSCTQLRPRPAPDCQSKRPSTPKPSPLSLSTAATLCLASRLFSPLHLRCAQNCPGPKSKKMPSRGKQGHFSVSAGTKDLIPCLPCFSAVHSILSCKSLFSKSVTARSPIVNSAAHGLHAVRRVIYRPLFL